MGEYLAIVRPNGTTIDDVFTPSFPEQLSDISYGPQSTDGQLRFFDVPTPGSPNGIGYPGVVKDTNFDVDRGFYDQSFSVTITSTPLDAAIRYNHRRFSAFTHHRQALHRASHDQNYHQPAGDRLQARLALHQC